MALTLCLALRSCVSACVLRLFVVRPVAGVVVERAATRVTTITIGGGAAPRPAFPSLGRAV